MLLSSPTLRKTTGKPSIIFAVNEIKPEYEFVWYFELNHVVNVNKSEVSE